MRGGARYRPIIRASLDSAGRVIKKRTLRQFSFSAPSPRRRQIGCIFKSPLCRAPPGSMSRVGSKINGAPLALMMPKKPAAPLPLGPMTRCPASLKDTRTNTHARTALECEARRGWLPLFLACLRRRGPARKACSLNNTRANTHARTPLERETRGGWVLLFPACLRRAPLRWSSRGWVGSSTLYRQVHPEYPNRVQG